MAQLLLNQLRSRDGVGVVKAGSVAAPTLSVGVPPVPIEASGTPPSAVVGIEVAVASVVEAVWVDVGVVEEVSVAEAGEVSVVAD